MYLMVEFPRVKTNDKEYSIVYYEKVFSHLLPRPSHISSVCFANAVCFNFLCLRMETTLPPSPPAVTLSKSPTHRWAW